MIQMISGATRLDGRVLRPESGPFSTDPAVEKHLIDRGVAAYVLSEADVMPAPAEDVEPTAEPTGEPAPDLTAEAPTKKTPPKKPAGKKS